MTPLKAKTVRDNIIKKGFVEFRDGTHRKYRFQLNGEYTSIWTMMSHNDQEVGSSLQSKMAKQLHLNNNEFFSFAICQMDMPTYIKQMRANGYLK